MRVLRCPFNTVRLRNVDSSVCPGYEVRADAKPCCEGCRPPCVHARTVPEPRRGAMVSVCGHPEAVMVIQGARSMIKEGGLPGSWR